MGVWELWKTPRPAICEFLILLKFLSILDVSLWLPRMVCLFPMTYEKICPHPLIASPIGVYTPPGELQRTEFVNKSSFLGEDQQREKVCFLFMQTVFVMDELSRQMADE